MNKCKQTSLEMAHSCHQLALDSSVASSLGSLGVGAIWANQQPVLRQAVLLRPGRRMWFGDAAWEGMPRQQESTIRPVLLRDLRCYRN